MNGNKFAGLFKPGTPEKEAEELPLADDETEELGACAAIAKDRWVSALTIKHAKGPWESLQYRHIGARSVYEPTRFELQFVGDDATWRVVVTGRKLERIYMLCIQGRMEWLRAADRDFDSDGKPIVTGIVVSKVEEPKGEK